MSQPSPSTIEALQDDAEAVIKTTLTGRTDVLRMRADMDPWTDNRVRTALKLCQDRQRILDLAVFGNGVVGQDHHVAPVHPEYCEIETPEFDPERAKELLEEAGFPDGLEFDLSVSSGRDPHVTFAETLKETAAEAGFTINIKTMPEKQYGQQWTEHVVGITSWGHRPLAMMVLPLAYGCEDGELAAWNESHWCNEEFSQVLREAQATVELEDRRELTCQLERIQQQEGTVGIPYWRNTPGVIRSTFKGYQVHPSAYDIFYRVWHDESA
jgi:peptide/nickel transport system substrate-binding protein